MLWIQRKDKQAMDPANFGWGEAVCLAEDGTFYFRVWYHS